MGNFLQNRSLYRSIAFYLGTSWVIIEASNYFISRFKYPDYLSDTLLILLAFGLLSLIMYEWTNRRSEKNKSNTLSYSLQVINALLAISFVLYFLDGKENKVAHFYEPSTEKVSIAVLPFIDMSPSKNSDWLGDGICDHIIDQLNSLQSIDVKSKSASFYFKDKDYNLVEVADILGVSNIVEGSVMMIDSMLRVSVKLIDPTTGSQIWNKSFERPFKNVFEIQSEIAISVANKIKAEISNEEIEEINEYPTENAQAYAAFMKGKYHYNLLTPKDNYRAHDYFKTAISLDSNLAPAYAYLGLTYNMWGGQWLGLTPDSAYKHVRVLANKALAISPDLPIGQLLLSNEKYFYVRDHKKGLELAASAYANSNEKEDVLWMYCVMLNMNRQSDKAIDLLVSHIEKNKTSAIAHYTLSNTYVAKRAFEEALNPSFKALELNPQMLQPRYYLGEAYFGMQDYETSIQYWDTLYKHVPIPRFLEGLMRSTYYSGDIEEAKKLFNSLLQLSEHMYMPYILATAYATFGDVDTTIKYLEEAYDYHAVEMVSIWREPAFDNMRDEPRFMEIVERFNFPE